MSKKINMAAALVFSMIIPSLNLAQTGDGIVRSVRPILAGDRLRITVEESPNLNRTYAVAGDGTIDVEYIGRVIVESKSTVEAAAYLKSLLEGSHFKRATVSVEVSEFVTGSILVLGAVGNPTSISYRGDEIITLIEALSQAGGMTARAAKDQVKIFRWKTGGAIERDIITVDVKKIMADLDFTKDQYLRPRDIVLVPELGDDSSAAEFLALGEFGNPGFHPHAENMDIIRAVIRAGGVNREAQLEQGRILRPDGTGNYSMIPFDLARLLGSADMKMNMPVFAGDILFLPSSQLSAGGKVYFLGEVSQPGAFPLSISGDSTLARTILQRGGFTKFSNGAAVKINRKAPDGSQQTLVFDVDAILKAGNFDGDLPLQNEDVIIVSPRIFSIF